MPSSFILATYKNAFNLPLAAKKYRSGTQSIPNTISIFLHCGLFFLKTIFIIYTTTH